MTVFFVVLSWPKQDKKNCEKQVTPPARDRLRSEIGKRLQAHITRVNRRWLQFVILVPTFSTNTRGNACYAGYLSAITMNPITILELRGNITFQTVQINRKLNEGFFFCFKDDKYYLELRK